MGYWEPLSGIWQPSILGMSCICFSRVLGARKYIMTPLLPCHQRMAELRSVGSFLCWPGHTDTRRQEVGISPILDVCPNQLGPAGQSSGWYWQLSPSEGFGSSVHCGSPTCPTQPECQWMRGLSLQLWCSCVPPAFHPIGPVALSSWLGTARAGSLLLAWELSLTAWKLCRIKAFHCCQCLPTPIAIKG